MRLRAFALLGVLSFTVPAAAQRSPASLRAVVDGHRAEMARCYESALIVANVSRDVLVDATIHIAADGTVLDVALRGAPLGTLHDCLGQRIRGWRFDADAGTSRISIPLVFRRDEPSSPGRPTAARILAVVQHGRAAIQRCYERAARNEAPPPTVRLEAMVGVAASGAVETVTIEGPSLGDLHACVRAELLGWRFPTSGEPTRIAIPLVFTSP